jgi:regulation of enolase protein 1 (concanavalin A-like superfamily)
MSSYQKEVILKTSIIWDLPSVGTSSDTQYTSLIHYKDSTYFAWIDGGQRPWIVQINDSGEVKMSPIDPKPDYTVQNDGHHRFSIGVDRDGYIHATGDMHNYSNTTGAPYIPRYQFQDMLYWKSKLPEDVTQGFDFVGYKGSPYTPPGSCFTYGRFFCDSTGNMFYSSRVRAIIGGHVPGEMGFGLFQYNERSCTWSAIGGLAQDTRKGIYGKILVWDNGGIGTPPFYQGFLSNLTFDKDNKLHLVTGISNNPKLDGNNSAIYAVTDDYGFNWRRKDKSLIKGFPLRSIPNLPNTADILETADAPPFLESRTCVLVDHEGNPGYLLKDWKAWNGKIWDKDIGLNVNRNNTSDSQKVPVIDYAMSDNKGTIVSICSGNARLLRSSSFKDRPAGYDLQGYLSYVSIDEYGFRRTGDIYGVGLGKDKWSILKTEIIPAPLPKGWDAHDIGTILPLYSGTAGYLDGEFVSTSYGLIIEGTEDNFHYIYKKMDRDCTIVALVDCTYLSSHSRLGVMIRNTLDPNSEHSFMGTTPGDKTTVCLYRKTKAGITAKTTIPLPASPYWMKISKIGNTLTNYISSDGITWIAHQNGKSTIDMSKEYYVGLASTSTHKYGMIRSSFKNVQLTENY